MKKTKKQGVKRARSGATRHSKLGAGRHSKSHPRVHQNARAVTRRSRVSTARPAARVKPKTAIKAVTQIHSRSVAKLAASVLSRRAAKVEAQAAAPVRVAQPSKAPGRTVAKAKAPSSTKHPRQSSARPGRLHGAASLPGNRPLVKAARMPQFNYMKAPGLDHGFDVGDAVEVFCDHEQDSERVRGWVKGVVVQVDNKLVAVQFRSNVFLTDGWMVPDRILWYSLGSDQIRSTGVAKKPAQVAIPEY